MEIKTKKVFIAGASGMVGSSLVRQLRSTGYQNLLQPGSHEVDLLRQTEVEKFFVENRPEIVILAAAKVGGILANENLRAEFIYENLMIEANVIHSAYRAGVQKLIMLGSSCIYPRLCPQPIKEEYLLTGPLEPTNEPYALAKIAGIKLCESYRKQFGCNFYSVMPTNLYGPEDNFDLNTSHVIPALIRKFLEAVWNGNPEVLIWGSGKARREFMHVKDCAEAITFLIESVESDELEKMGLSHINIGTGSDLTIAELAEAIAYMTGFRGTIAYDSAKPDGTPQKLLDVSRLRSLGWSFSTSLKAGLEQTIKWYSENVTASRGIVAAEPL